MDESRVITQERCEKDHALWTEEIAAWQRDHARALHTLEEATAFILEHEAELEEHLRAIDEHEEAHARQSSRIETHRERHLEVQHRHNVFRGRHRSLIEEIMRLRVVLHKAGHREVF